MPDLPPSLYRSERPGPRESLGVILRRKLDELAAEQAAGVKLPVDSKLREAFDATEQRGQQ